MGKQKDVIRYSRSLERKNFQAFCLLQISMSDIRTMYLNPEFQKKSMEGLGRKLDRFFEILDLSSPNIRKKYLLYIS